MNIVHVCQFLGMGGLERAALSLCKEQISRGHRVKVLVYDADKALVPLFRQNGVPVDDGYQKRPGYDLNLLRWLRQKIRGADIVHTHDLNPALYLAPLKWTGNCDFIHTIHGMEDAETGLKQAFMERIAGMSAGRVAAVAPAFRDFHAKPFGRVPGKVSVVYNGIDASQFSWDGPSKPKLKKRLCETHNLDPRLPLGVCVGRISEMKGQLELIRWHPKANRNLLLVGPSADAGFNRQCRRLLPKNAAMTGPRNDISRILAACDYFVSASKHEGVPIAVLEAGAAGLPCALSDIPGHRAFNSDRQSVYLFKGKTGLEKALARMDEDGGARALVFREEIIKKRSSAATAERYLELYAELACLGG